MLQYRPTTTQGPWTWLNEMRAGQSGYFLTGTVGDSSLWRLFRVETDAFRRAVFTLSPVRLTAGCPRADFSSLSDPLLASEVTAQYRDLCASVVSHAYRDVVTKARNIVEGLVSTRLKAAGNLPAATCSVIYKRSRNFLKTTNSETPAVGHNSNTTLPTKSE